MRRVCLSAAVSLDGYVAGPNGEHDWIVVDPEIDFRALLARFDTVLLGRKSYELTRAAGRGAGMPGMEAVVFSRTLDPADCPGVTLSDDPVRTVAELRTRPGKDLWLFGGGELFRSFLTAGLVDAIELAVVPVLLGGGIPLLPPPAPSAPLRLVRQRTLQATGTVMLEYAPR